jgi:PAS domain S-box-containing protein
LKTILGDLKNSPTKVKNIAASDTVKTIFSHLFSARRGILQAEALNTPVSKMDLESSRRLLRMSLNDLVILDTLAAIGLYGIFHLQIVNRVARVSDNSLRLASGHELQTPLQGADEIQKLDLNFHSMANQLIATRKSLETSEKRIRDIVNNVPHGLLVVAPDMTIEFANKTIELMFKHPPGVLIGQSVESLFNTSADFSTLIEDSLTNSQELDAERCDGNTFRAELSSNRIDFVDGERTLLAVEDITERYELSRLKKEFVAMVCHDLRNPLSAIQLFQEMLASNTFGQLTEPGPKLLNNARVSTTQLMTLTNDILESEKLESGTSVLSLATVDLNLLIEQAIASSLAAITLKEITINYEPRKLEIKCDASKILRVLSNLIGNAAKFSPQKSQLTVATKIDEDTVRISVTDEGKGVPEKMQQAILKNSFKSKVSKPQAELSWDYPYANNSSNSMAAPLV